MTAVSKYSDKEFAEQFIKLGKRFIDYHIDNECELRFPMIEIVKFAGRIKACHGGFAALILTPGNITYKRDWESDNNVPYTDGIHYGKRLDYMDGMRLISEFLGFENAFRFTDWAENNKELWGYPNARGMFSFEGYIAFGRTEDSDPMDLADIGAHYIKVGERIHASIKPVPFWVRSIDLIKEITRGKL